MAIEIFERPIAITDVETTGLDPQKHEIVEIGLVLVDQQTGKVIDTLDIKVKPEHIETADETALKVNGYKAADWQAAVSIIEAMTLYGQKVENAIFCSHNVTFDWSFISAAFKKVGLKNTLDYHRLDLFSLIWAKTRDSDIESFSLSKVAQFLGLPEEPLPHRAINGARTAHEIYKKITHS
ncbi:3'-5' exonuclease [Candidatus Collierbacteria bacterium]|nr:3'-5' exonuclease [Candidatus Collierbacteria bacterium]